MVWLQDARKQPSPVQWSMCRYLVLNSRVGEVLNPAIADGLAALVKKWQQGPAGAVKVFYRIVRDRLPAGQIFPQLERSTRDCARQL